MSTSATRVERVRHLVLEGELGRRLIHVAGSAIPLFYFLPWVEWWHLVALMLAGTATAAVLEVVRLRVGLDWFIYEHLTREYEQDAPAAYLMYAASGTAVAVVFEPRVAIPAILMLTLADPVAGVVSADELRRVKRPQALATMLVTCAVLAVPFFHERPLAVVLGATGGMLADGIKPTVRGVVVDDNLTIAPAGAIGLWLGLTLGPVVV